MYCSIAGESRGKATRESPVIMIIPTKNLKYGAHNMIVKAGFDFVQEDAASG